MATPTSYASFLVRLWRKGGSGRPETTAAWQSEVEHIQSSQCWTFGNLEELLGFLRQQVEELDVMCQSEGERFC